MNNNWGYCANDHYYKPASMLIKKLVECVSKGGNMILNVGPDAKGKFPKESSAILAEIGRWMDKNHDSIYGCAPAADIPKPDYGRITSQCIRVPVLDGHTAAGLRTYYQKWKQVLCPYL